MRAMHPRLVVPPVRYREYQAARAAEAARAEEAERRITTELELEELERKGIVEPVG